MSFDQYVVLSVLVGSLGLFVWGRIRFDLVALLALLLVTVAGVVPAREAFRGFGHPAVVTVAAVLLISHALARSGFVELLADRVASLAKGPVSYMAILSGLVGGSSAFMNNVGALALMLPVAIRSAARIGRPLSQTLMPLSFASLLGGLTTLIGTPPNIIIATQREEIAGEAFGMFAFTPVGAGVACAGIAFIALCGWRLLPARRPSGDAEKEPFDVNDYITELEIGDDSELRGLRPGALASKGSSHLRVLGLRRGTQVLSRKADNEPLETGDVVILEGAPAQILDLAGKASTDIVTRRPIDRSQNGEAERVLVEAVVSQGSRLDGRRPDRALLHHRYRVGLLAVSRQNRPAPEGFPGMQLGIGDVLLLEGERKTLAEDLNQIGCLPLATRALPATEKQTALLPLALFALGIGLTATGILAVHVSFVAVALMIVLCGCVPLREIYEKIQWPVIVLLGAFLPVGRALKDTGTTDLIVEAALGMVEGSPALALLAGTIVISMLLSDLINNAAAAVVMTPIGVSLAQRMDLSADPFLMAVAVGCTCTFLTPIGHQSNALVFGPGGYRFGDYWRMGLPLGLIVIVVATALISFFWLP